MAEIAPQPGIMDIALYHGGASQIAGRTDVVKLSSNENPWGPSPKAISAAQTSLTDMHRYPSTDHGPLRAAIADIHGLDADRIVCGVGSDEIIAFLCQCYAGPGTEVLYPEYGFLMYRISAMAAGATPVTAPEPNRVVDVDAMLAAVTERTRLVFVANPANPTSTMIDSAALTRLADGLPPHVVLVLDGAYVEFVPGYDGGLALVEARDNVVMTRTFSKLYGLGGLRIGWAYAPRAIIDVLNRVRGPFNLSTTQLIAAEAAVRDQDFAQRCVDETLELRSRLVAGLRQLGVGVDEAHGNFVLARFADAAEADAADAHLQSHGILARKVDSYGLPEGLRITVPAAPDLDRLMAAMVAFREVAT